MAGLLLVLMFLTCFVMSSTDKITREGWYKDVSSIAEISVFSFSSNSEFSTNTSDGDDASESPLGFFFVQSSINTFSNFSSLHLTPNRNSSILLLMCPLDFWLKSVKLPLEDPSKCILETEARDQIYANCPVVQWMDGFTSDSYPIPPKNDSNRKSNSTNSSYMSPLIQEKDKGVQNSYSYQAYNIDDDYPIYDNEDDDADDDDYYFKRDNEAFFEYMKLFLVYSSRNTSSYRYQENANIPIRPLVDKIYAYPEKFYIFSVAFCGDEKFKVARRSSSSMMRNGSSSLAVHEFSVTSKRVIPLEIGKRYYTDEKKSRYVMNEGNLYETSELASFEMDLVRIYRSAVLVSIVIAITSIFIYMIPVLREKYQRPNVSLLSLLANSIINIFIILFILIINNVMTMILLVDYEKANMSLFDVRNVSFSRVSTIFYSTPPNQNLLMIRDSLDWILSTILIYLLPCMIFKHIPLYRDIGTLAPGEWRSIAGSAMFTAWIAFIRYGDDFRMNNIYSYLILHVWFALYHFVHNSWSQYNRLCKQFEKMWKRVVREVPALANCPNMKQTLRGDVKSQIGGYLFLMSSLLLVFHFLPFTIVLPWIEVNHYFGYRRNNITTGFLVGYQLFMWSMLFLVVLLKVLPFRRNQAAR